MPANERDAIRAFEFCSTPAVTVSRAHQRFVRCPACQADTPRYLFHRTGVRFVRCGSCDMIYVNPASDRAVNYFDIDGVRPFSNAKDRELAIADFGHFLERVAADFSRAEHRPLARTALLGRYLRGFRELAIANTVGLEFVEVDDATFTKLALESDISWASSLLAKAPDVVILHELLEACGDPGAMVAKLVALLPASTRLVVTYTNVDSIPARMMRRYWPPFFEVKTAFFRTGNLTSLMARFGLGLTALYPFPVMHTAQYIAERIVPGTRAARILQKAPLRRLPVPVRAGNRVAVFARRATPTREKLSIVLPVFNEARYVQQVIEAILAKPLKVDKELVVVESNSTDGTRDIVQRFANRQGVRVILEERPQGKGHAVRMGLKAVTGTIVLIQDADFEYDIDDYDALLEPILQHKATFVLGSRSLGLDDWKVRRYGNDATRALAMNFAQLVFAKTYNVLYQQHVTDVNTMFKVFRAECLDGLELESDGFELDIELACKLARNGNAPMEVPVNYVSRGFDEGKKIRFLRDPILSYSAFFKYRFT
jgi:hypothetical protein